MTQLATLPAQQIDRLDAVASNYQLQAANATPFQKTFILATSIQEMRELMPAAVLKPIMALQNTDLGFRTDKPEGGYPDQVVRDIIIEATLRGYYPVGNEFNIIAGRFYAAKNGIRRKVTNWPGLTDFKDTYAVPRTAGDKGAIVQAKATWKLGGVADSIEREIPVRVNGGMGTDAILGKAERKLLKSILDRISGEITPDGEVGDEPINVTAEPAASTAAAFRDVLGKKKAEKAAPEPSSAPAADNLNFGDTLTQAPAEEASNEKETALGRLLMKAADYGKDEITEQAGVIDLAGARWPRFKQGRYRRYADLPEDLQDHLFKSFDFLMEGAK